MSSWHADRPALRFADPDRASHIRIEALSVVCRRQKQPASIEQGPSPATDPSCHRSDGSCSGGVQARCGPCPAARPLAAMTSAILRDASSIISSPSIAAPRAPPAAEVYQS